jgi:hypothetical protein
MGFYGAFPHDGTGRFSEQVIVTNRFQKGANCFRASQFLFGLASQGGADSGDGPESSFGFPLGPYGVSPSSLSSASLFCFNGLAPRQGDDAPAQSLVAATINDEISHPDS